MEGGEIWYENLIFDPFNNEDDNSNKNINETKNALLIDNKMEIDNDFYNFKSASNVI